MKIMVPLADGFEEIEALTIIDVLRRAGINVETVGVVGSLISGCHNVRVNTDKKLAEINEAEYDGIILPGGPGTNTLARTSKIISIIKRLNAEGKLIGAICAAPSVLSKAGILENKKATIYPGMEKELQYPRGERVVIDGKIITSQAPGTAMEFALKIVEHLVGSEKAAKLRKELVF